MVRTHPRSLIYSLATCQCVAVCHSETGGRGVWRRLSAQRPEHLHAEGEPLIPAGAVRAGQRGAGPVPSGRRLAEGTGSVGCREALFRHP